MLLATGGIHLDLYLTGYRFIPTIGVLWGVGSEQELREAGAVALVATPAEIPPLLDLA